MSGRALKLLAEEYLPAETKESMNASPWLQIGVLLFMLVLGPFLIKFGRKGIKNKVIVSKGREYTGTAAVVVGALWVLSGIILLGGALVVGFVTFVAPRLN